MEVEALAGEEEVFQWSAWRQDCAQRGSPIVTDAECGTLGSGGVTGICQRGAGVEAFNAAFKPRKSISDQIKAVLELFLLRRFVGPLRIRCDFAG